MSFDNYLTEAVASPENDEIDLEDFIKKIKSKGLYGYNIFKHISEDELKKILADDTYFTKKIKDSTKQTISEMVVPPKKEGEDNPEDKSTNQPQQNKLSLAVRLGLKKEAQQSDNDTDKTHVFGSSNNSNSSTNQQQEKPKPLSFADRMRAESERRAAERIEQQKRDQEMRDQKMKHAEENANKVDVTFNNKSLSAQNNDDGKLVDKTNDNLDKQLTNSMFKKKVAKVSTDDNGYKKVDNAGEVDDKNANDNLKKEMDNKFPKEKTPVDNEQQSTQVVKKQTSVEYSKRTLLAIADRMDFDVYCKFKKANGQIRTGNFRIGKSDAQITQKQNTIIVRDLDLDDWRTIPLDRIISIKPI